jgi:hypothetical protein
MIGHAVHRLGVLLLTVALALWPMVNSGVRASMSLEVAAVAPMLLSPKFLVLEPCGAANSHDMSATVCSVHCGLAAAIVPVATVLPAMVVSRVGPSVNTAAEDRRPSPSLHPPSPASIEAAVSAAAPGLGVSYLPGCPAPGDAGRGGAR